METEAAEYHKDDLDYILTEIIRHPLANDMGSYFQIIDELQEGLTSFQDIEYNIEEWYEDS